MAVFNCHQISKVTVIFEDCNRGVTKIGYKSKDRIYPTSMSDTELKNILDKIYKMVEERKL